MKKVCKELEMKGKGFKKRLDDLHVALSKHIEQYASASGFLQLLYIVNFLDVLSCIFTSDECRVQKDLVDQEKFQATLNDETLATSCDLKRALEMVAILEAQLKEMNPNLDSISEYDFSPFMTWAV